jgi:hypothetical protein
MGVHMLPLRTDLPHYLFSVELEGRTYTVELRWNERAAGWFLSLLTADEVPIVQGRRVVVGFPLLARTRDFRLPPGELEAIDTTGSGRDPGLTELGARVQLMYTDSADLPAGYTAP